MGNASRHCYLVSMVVPKVYAASAACRRSAHRPFQEIAPADRWIPSWARGIVNAASDVHRSANY
jgi:hypothetical protein